MVFEVETVVHIPIIEKVVNKSAVRVFAIIKNWGLQPGLELGLSLPVHREISAEARKTRDDKPSQRHCGDNFASKELGYSQG